MGFASDEGGVELADDLALEGLRSQKLRKSTEES